MLTHIKKSTGISQPFPVSKEEKKTRKWATQSFLGWEKKIAQAGKKSYKNESCGQK